MSQFLSSVSLPNITVLSTREVLVSRGAVAHPRVPGQKEEEEEEKEEEEAAVGWVCAPGAVQVVFGSSGAEGDAAPVSTAVDPWPG